VTRLPTKVVNRNRKAARVCDVPESTGTGRGWRTHAAETQNEESYDG